MSVAGISVHQIATRAGVQVKWVKRVLRGASTPCDAMTNTLADVLEVDAKWLRRLRGLDRAEATRTFKRMQKVVGPMQDLLRAEFEAQTRFLDPDDETGGPGGT
jgi:transcriptional regulator with XRE-family HTH domain